MVLASFVQNLWAVLGAVSGIAIGLTKEGVDLFSSLRSVQGWKQVYTGTASTRSKKVDHGSRAAAYSHEAPKSGQAEVKQFLGTRPPDLKASQPSTGTYSNAPILGGQNARPSAPKPFAVNETVNASQTSAPLPFALPAGTTSRPVLGDPLPDIFGKTSFMGGRPAAQPAAIPPPVSVPAGPISPLSPVSSPATTVPTVVASPKGAVVNGTSPAPSEEAYTEDDGASTADEGGSPEANLSTGAKIKKLRKRISNKLSSKK